MSKLKTYLVRSQLPLVLALGSQMSDMYVAALPLWFQIGLFRPLAALARRLGYERKLNRYLTA